MMEEIEEDSEGESAVVPSADEEAKAVESRERERLRRVRVCVLNFILRSVWLLKKNEKERKQNSCCEVSRESGGTG